MLSDIEGRNKFPVIITQKFSVHRNLPAIPLHGLALQVSD